jgi:glycosyltransferase involved in cell wall biosynthesis
LTDQIEAVLADPAKAAEASAATRKLAHDEFSWDAAGKKIQDIYYSCLSQDIESTSRKRFL